MNSRSSHPPTLRIKRLLSELTSSQKSESRVVAIVSELIDYFAQSHLLALTPSYLYLTGKPKTGATPLHLFLDQGRVDNADFLEEFCRRLSWNVFCKLLATVDTDGNLPIHYACRYCSAPVIDFLFQQQPNLLMHQGTSSQFEMPFVEAMKRLRHQVPVTTLRKMLQVCPGAAVDASILPYAIYNSFPVDLLDAIANEFPTTNFFKLDLPGNGCFTPVTLDLSRVLCKVLPKVSILHLKVNDWESVAFNLFAQTLGTQAHDTIAEIAYLTLPSRTGREDIYRCIENLVVSLAPNTSLKRAHLFTVDQLSVLPWACILDRCFHAVDGAYANRENVVIREARPRETFGGFWEYSLRPCATNQQSSLHLNFQRFNSPWDNDTQEGIQIFLSAKGFQSLTSLILHSGRRVAPPQKHDITGLALAALQELPRLRELRLFGFEIDYKLLFDALRENSQLQVFNTFHYKRPSDTNEPYEACIETLKLNTTLIECDPFGSSTGSRVHYYLHLNRMGRSRVRNSDIIPTEVWIQLLLAVESDEYLSAQEERVRQSLWCGLMRENPGLWCHGTGRVVREHISILSGRRLDPYSRHTRTLDWMVPPPSGFASPLRRPKPRRSRRLKQKEKLP
ncbi:expressed unknown protein [Seminavis robusta]|uniref:Uncharacterized protein n=1 Tax=Seminavis robusta TaxID=568900 RepID=A0A9N8EKX3_9STRA|nr:expressed unknown protein [Seminavis robusta]|eukprot:Sro1254_g256420.1 n/a (621) ;mRNA; f:15813-17675